MELAAEISARRLAGKVGRTMDVLVDQVSEGMAVGRSTSDAPEIDGTVRIAGNAKTLQRISVGSIVRVQITGSSAYDLEARLAG
jgi:ribosomal protein S12 methylthiotransferase